MQLSVAIPVYNERDVLPELLTRIGAVLDGVRGGPHQIVLADDGSSDGSFEFLARASDTDPRITVVRLARNFGHQIALTAALDHAEGDAVIIMDGDLQDSPEAIPVLLAKFAQGYDVVYAQRERRKEGILLRLCYRVFYRLISRMSRIELPLDAGDFALLSRRVVQQLRRAPERHRYLRGLRAWVGFRQIGVPVERAARQKGESKYTFAALLQLALDGILSFSAVPLRVAALLGFFALLACIAFAIYSVLLKLLLGQSPAGFTALILVTTFLSAIQLLFLGLIGEYIGRIYEEVKRRPLYVVERVLRCPAATGLQSASRQQPQVGG